MKRILAILLVLAIALSMSACHKHRWEPATCDSPKTCSVCGKTQGDPLGHKWGEPSYEWSDDLSSVTASRVCQNDPAHVESETVDVTVEELKAATCTEAGESRFTAEFENPVFAAQTRVEALPAALGHDWDETVYEWSDDLSSVTATRVCRNDPAHVETEIAEVTAEVTRQPGCEEPGETSYSVTFGNEGFAPQTRTEANIEPLGHDWGEPSYEWSEDMSSVTASHACMNDPGHVESETVPTTVEYTKEGEAIYSAVFADAAFAAQSRTEPVAAAPAGSDAAAPTGTGAETPDEPVVEARRGADAEPKEPVWSEPVFAWSEDMSSVTVTAAAQDDPDNTISETAVVTAEVTKPATCTEPGETTYTAAFENPAFAAQSRTEADVEALGHAWGEPAYEWSEDLSSVTATRVCANDPDHVETETAAVTAEITKPATCTEMGETSYTAVFENPAFAAQSRTEADVEALGHDWLKATHTQPKTCSVCGETEGEPLPIFYFDKSFKDFRHVLKRSYPAFMSVEPSSHDGYTLRVKGETIALNGLSKPVLFYHADEFDQGPRDSLDQLERFNMIEISYLSDSPNFDTSISARIAQFGYYAAKILDPDLEMTAFFKEGLDLFDAKGNEQSFTHNGFVYTLSCTPEGEGYRYVFRMTLEANLE